MDEEEIRQLMGKRIRDAREKLGLSQEQLAERIDRNQYSVSEYENGKRQIFAHNLPIIAKALEVPISYFFYETSEERAFDDAILEEVHGLPTERARQAAIRILRELRNATELDDV